MRYRRHADLVDAIEWTGENLADVCTFMGISDPATAAVLASKVVASALPIETPLGVEWAKPNDFIVRETRGYLTIWPHDTFLERYDAVEAEGAPS